MISIDGKVVMTSKELDRFLNLLLLLSFTMLAGVFSLALHLEGSSFVQVWQETKAEIAQAQARQQQRQPAALPAAVTAAPIKKSALMEKATQKISDLSQAVTEEKLQAAKDCAKKSVDCVWQGLQAMEKKQENDLAAECVNDLHELFPIVAKVESGGDPDKVGDKGKAVGVAQIWKAVVDDVNRIEGEKKFRYCDRASVDKSKEIFAIYLDYYGELYQDKTGKEPTLEIWARIWNGGPLGWQKTKTQKYWRKVSDTIESPDV